MKKVKKTIFGLRGGHVIKKDYRGFLLEKKFSLNNLENICSRQKEIFVNFCESFGITKLPIISRLISNFDN